jgi:arsenate reductase
VITVCDQAAGESCPLFPGNPSKHHWSTPDPAKVVGSDAEIDAAFDQAFFMLKSRVQELEFLNQMYPKEEQPLQVSIPE